MGTVESIGCEKWIQSLSMSRSSPFLVQPPAWWIINGPWVIGYLRQVFTIYPESFYVQKLSNLGPTFLGDKQFLSKIRSLSKVCPFPDFVQSMSNQNSCISKAQNMNPDTFSQVQYMSRYCPMQKNGNILNFSAQSLDKLWIFMSNLCPEDFEFDTSLTEI